MRTITIMMILIISRILFSCILKKNIKYKCVYEIKEDVLYLNLNGETKPLFDFETGQYLDSLTTNEKKKIGKFLKKKNRLFNKKNKQSKFR